MIHHPFVLPASVTIPGVSDSMAGTVLWVAYPHALTGVIYTRALAVNEVFQTQAFCDALAAVLRQYRQIYVTGYSVDHHDDTVRTGWLQDVHDVFVRFKVLKVDVVLSETPEDVEKARRTL